MSPPEDGAFAANLKRLKEESGATWDTIALQALNHRNPRYIMLLASGRHVPNLATTRRLADYFGVGMDEFVRES